MHSNESTYDKQKNRQGSRNIPKDLIIIFTIIVVFLVITFSIVPLDNGYVEAYIRYTFKPEVIIEKVKKQPKLTFSDLNTSLEDAKMEIEESELEVLEKVEEELFKNLSELEIKIKKSLKILLNGEGLSPEKEKEILNAIVEELEYGVKKRIETEASKIGIEAGKNLEKIVKNDMKARVNPKGIETDVLAMRDYFSKEAQQGIKLAGEMIKGNIESMVEEIEKRVIADKLGIILTENKLVISEFESMVSDAASELIQIEKDEFKKFEQTVSEKVKQIIFKVDLFLTSFLSNKKGLDSFTIKQISLKISDQFEQSVNKKLKYGFKKVKEEVDKVAHFELNNIIQKDLVKLQALDMKRQISQVENVLKDYLNDTVALLMKDVQNGFWKDMKKIISQVFENEDIIMNETELETLINNDKFKIS